MEKLNKNEVSHFLICLQLRQSSCIAFVNVMHIFSRVDLFHHASQILKNPRIKVADKGLRLKKKDKKFRLSPDVHYIGYTQCRS